MLTREVMGLLALAVLWVNALLIAYAAEKLLDELNRRGRRMLAAGTIEGIVGGSSPIAVHEIEQVGRQADRGAARPAILFHDRRHASRILGGSVATAAGELLVAPEETRADVWIAKHDVQCAEQEFAAAYAQSGKANGYERVVRTEIRPGERVWIHGKIAGDRIIPLDHAPLLVAAMNPLAWLRRRCLVLLAFIGGTPTAAALITWLALREPHFGTVSTIGAALGMLFFLLIQPGGTAVRDFARLPSEALVRGMWIAPEPAHGKSWQQRTPVE